jgi:hypothetical protein
MIYVLLDGRLGNHLFQMATAFSMTQNVTLSFKSATSQVYFASSRASILYSRFPVVDCAPPHVRVYREPSFNYVPIPYCEGEDLVLDGCFQSERYLNRAAVLQLFAVPQNIKTEIFQKHGAWLNRTGVTGMHVRRGDYLQSPHRHPFVGQRYYFDAIERIGPNKPFIVCSDDIAWCKKTFQRDNFYFVENSDPVTDLYIQSLCQNNIMSNSTFSWWGAWLNPNPCKIVVAPSMWFGIAARQYDCSDLYPKSYLRVRNRYAVSQYVFARYLMLRTAIGNLCRACARAPATTHCQG